MLRRSVIPKSFRSGARLQYSRHAHALLQPSISSVLLLTLLFLYTNWCYQSLKKRVDTERLSTRNERPGSPYDSASSGEGGLLFSWGLDSQYRLGRMGGDLTAPQVTLPQLQVASAAASRHTLLLTLDGVVWSMGANDSHGGGGHGSRGLAASGQLGRPGSWAPARVHGQLQGLVVKQVAAGRYHSVAVAADGRVFTWGLNDWGQLGRSAAAGATELAAPAPSAATGGSNDTTVQQQQATYHKDERLPRRRRGLATIAPAAAGAAGQQSIGSTANSQGDVQGAATATSAQSDTKSDIGSAPTGAASSLNSRCTSGWSCHDGSPGLVEALANTSVVAAKAGRYSTVVLDVHGQLWVWGYDGCASGGQVPQQADAWRPRLVQGQLKGQRVVAFDVGYTFWLAATEDGALYTCDTQDDGYAGTLPVKRAPNNAGQLGRSGPPHEPGRVLGALLHKSVAAVAAGREHALVATSDGQLYSFGGGRAVLGREGPNDEPRRVTGGLDGLFTQHVAAGEYFSLAATNDLVFGWGSNAYLCTGTGLDKGQEVLQPTAVSGMLSTGEWAIRGLFAGYQHAFAVADQPASGAVAKIRSEALAAGTAQATGSQPGANPAAGVATGVAPVEVVLTEQQQLERQRAQQSVHKEAEAPPAAAPLVHHAEAHHATQATQQQLQDKKHSADAQQVQTTEIAQGQAEPGIHAAVNSGEVGSSGSRHPGGVLAPAQNSSSTAGLPADYHSSYLTQQLSPVTNKVHEVWASWKPSPWHDALVALSPDVFKLLPKAYNTMHKNPCWGGQGPELACLPYFNIIGVSKCGTTDLYHRLTLYKQRILPASNKGPHFWDECAYPPSGPCPAGPSSDFQAYITLFNRASDLIRSRPGAITGEASSNTFTSANGIYLRGFRGNMPLVQWAGAAGINATMPALLREAQPYLRLILMLRDPVTRYQSAFYYYRWWLKEEQKHPTADDFHQHTLKEVQQWKDCVGAATVTDCVRRFKPQQLVKGMYAEFLPDWLRHWPRAALLVIRYEDYIAALPQHLQAVLRFLDVEEPHTATLATMTKAEVQNKKSYPPMRADTRELLQALYEPYNEALARMLGDKRWTWKDTQPAG